MPLKPVDTAIKVIVGPAIDDTDFKAREEALTYDQAGIEVTIILEKHDGTVVTTAVTPTDTGGDYDWAHTNQGYYELKLTASGGASYNNDTEGILKVIVYCTGVLPFNSVAYDIIPTKVYDSIVIGTDNLEVDLIQWLGVAPLALSSQYVRAALATTPPTSAQIKTAVEAAGSHLALIKGYTDLIDDATNGLAAIKAEVEGLAGEAMRGTDNVVLAGPTKAEMDVAHALLATAVNLATVAGYVDTEITTIIETISALNNISVADIIAGITDGSYDLQQMIRLIFAACCLKSAGGGTDTITFRDSADEKDRISAVVNEEGNREEVTLDGD